MGFMPGLCVPTNDGSKRRRTFFRLVKNSRGAAGFSYGRPFSIKLIWNTLSSLRNKCWMTKRQGWWEVLSKNGWVEIITARRTERLWNASWKTCRRHHWWKWPAKRWWQSNLIHRGNPHIFLPPTSMCHERRPEEAFLLDKHQSCVAQRDEIIGEVPLHMIYVTYVMWQPVIQQNQRQSIRLLLTTTMISTTLVRIYHIGTSCLIHIRISKFLLEERPQLENLKSGSGGSWKPLYPDRVNWLLNSSLLHILRSLHNLEPICWSSSVQDTKVTKFVTHRLSWWLGHAKPIFLIGKFWRESRSNGTCERGGWMVMFWHDWKWQKLGNSTI